jgi:hypothetical protein
MRYFIKDVGTFSKLGARTSRGATMVGAKRENFERNDHKRNENFEHLGSLDRRK